MGLVHCGRYKHILALMVYLISFMSSGVASANFGYQLQSAPFPGAQPVVSPYPNACPVFAASSEDVQGAGDTPHLSAVTIHISATEVQWHVRRPGNFYTRFAEIIVEFNGDDDVLVDISFSGFAPLWPKNGGPDIPVFYRFCDGISLSDHWHTASELTSNTVISFSAAKIGAFSLWQMVSVGEHHAPGRYTNVGVMTFSLVNVQTHYE